MRAALQFLTILPVPAPAVKPGSSAWAFPIVGVLFGLLCALLLPFKLGPITFLVLLSILTGGLHEDGLADVCDAVRSYRTRERMHQILKDSRIGAHGALALICCFVFRWQALTLIAPGRWLLLAGVYGISRAQMVLLAASSPAAGDGLVAAFIKTIPSYGLWFAAAEAVLLCAVTGWPAGVALLVANLVLLLLVRWWFIARLGGVTGDCMGCICVLSEAVSLGVLACL